LCALPIIDSSFPFKVSEFNFHAAWKFPFKKRLRSFGSELGIELERVMPKAALVSNLSGITSKYNRTELRIKDMS
jgi:hypothetical protein